MANNYEVGAYRGEVFFLQLKSGVVYSIIISTILRLHFHR